eukprot:11375854-Alexandrium_andersonii.AAC.1
MCIRDRHGGNDAQCFYDQWIEYTSGLEPGIPNHATREILREKMKNSPALEPDLGHYDRLPLNTEHPHRTEAGLLEGVRLMLERRRRQSKPAGSGAAPRG